MQTFVKLRPAARISYIGLKAAEGIEPKINHGNFAMDVDVQAVMLADGSMVSTVQPNQSFTVPVGTLTPPRYTLMMVMSPAVQNACIGPSILMLEPGESLELTMNFKALRKLDLTSIPYFARIYLID